MATAQTIIDRAMRLIGAVASGEAPTAQESADALVALNAMLDSWALDRLLVNAWQTESFTLTPGVGSYTIGPSGVFNTVKPVRIEEAYVREAGVDYPVCLVTAGQWAGIADKATQSNLPEYLYYESGATLGTIQLHAVPNTANELKLVTWVQLAAIATLATTITLAKGYERALAYNLALEIALEFEKEPSSIVAGVAAQSLEFIRRSNNRPVMMRPEFSVGGSSYDIESDQ